MKFFDNLTITSKLIAITIGTSVLLSAALTAASVAQLSNKAEYAERQKLIAIAESRRDALSDYLASIEQDLRTLAASPFTLEALRAYETGWSELGSDQRQVLQELYITNNPHPTGEKEELDYAADGSSYSSAHAAYHPWFRQFLRERGYYDVFLFSNDGELIYSVFKELDYATNLRTGEWADSDLGVAFRAAADTLSPGEIAFFDFKPYAPSHGAPASFISTPIPDGRGGAAGVLVFQMPIDRLNEVMSSSAGLGESGETFVVGEDSLMRTNAPRAGESTILKGTVSADLLKWDEFAETASSTGAGYTGNIVMAAAAPMPFEGVRWRVVAQIDRDEAMAAVGAVRNRAVLIAIGFLALVGGLSTLIARRISPAP